MHKPTLHHHEYGASTTYCGTRPSVILCRQDAHANLSTVTQQQTGAPDAEGCAHSSGDANKFVGQGGRNLHNMAVYA